MKQHYNRAFCNLDLVSVRFQFCILYNNIYISKLSTINFIVLINTHIFVALILQNYIH